MPQGFEPDAATTGSRIHGNSPAKNTACATVAVRPAGTTRNANAPQARSSAQPISQLSEAQSQDQALLGHLLLVAAKVAQQEGLSSWRTVINTGAEAGQTVFHLHLHVIGGRPLAWPPG